MAKKNDDKQPIIIIKKVKKVDGGHHGGAWKVAYADFVTAMMAFFLLLWLLNVTTDEQKEMISSYFAPTDFRVSDSSSGAGGVMGGTTVNPEGAMSANNASSPTNSGTAAESEDPNEELKKELDKSDTKAFKETEQKLKEAVEKVPELKELAQNLLVDMTPEGLRIQIVDQEGKPMFESGSAKPLPSVVKLLGLVTQAIKDMPNKISLRGHTDSKQYSKDAAYSNWELSADRANTSRRLMLQNGFELNRIENIQGKADREPLVLNDTESPRNRRISIILLKQSLALDNKVKTNNPAPKAETRQEPQTKKREPGVIYFP